MTKTKLLLLIAVTMLFSGCALTNYKIEKPYEPISQKFNDIEKYSVSTKVNFQPVFTNDSLAVGIKKGGSGQETARIYLSENVDEWVKKGFDKELKIAGFNVENSQNNIKITLDIKQLFVEPWVGFNYASLIGISKIEAKVEFPQKDSFYVRRFVTYNTAARMIWTDSMYEARFMGVIQKSLCEIVKEIRLLLLEKNK